MVQPFGGRDTSPAIGYRQGNPLTKGTAMASHHDHSEHKIGTMDITEQQKTFAGFIKFATWTCILSLAVLVFMALANS